jgi:hypothetical protein
MPTLRSLLSSLLPGAFTGILAAAAVVAAVLFSNEACTKAQAASDLSVAVDLTDAACTVAADSPIGQPFTDIVCVIATGVEQGIALLSASDAGAASFNTAPTYRTVRIRLPSSEVPQFLAAHAKPVSR